MIIPGAIIYINSDISQGVQNKLVSQLIIDQVLDGYVFDGYVAINPNYPHSIHSLNQRILVIRNDFSNTINRNLADIAIFVKAGLASVELNKFGPPAQTYNIDRITIYSLVQPGYSSNGAQVNFVSVKLF